MGSNAINEHVGYVENNGKFWYISERSNILMKVDLEGLSVSAEMILPTYESFGFRALGYKNGKLLLAPFYDDTIIVRNADGKCIKKKINEGYPGVRNGCCCTEKYAYLYGNTPEVYRVDYDLKKVDILGIPCADGFLKDDIKLGMDSFECDDTLYIPLLDVNGIVKIDCKADDKITILRLGKNKRKWKNATVRHEDDCIYALWQDVDGTYKSAKYDMFGNELFESVVEINREIEIYPHTKACLVDDKWLVLPYRYTRPGMVSVTGGVEEDIHFTNSADDETIKLFNACIEVKEKVYAMDQLSHNKLLIIDKNTRTAEMVELSVIHNDMIQLLSENEKEDVFMIVESKGYVEINDYIDYVAKI